MKGLKSITREINKFLAPFECSCRAGTEFCYLYDKSLILYAFVTPVKAENEFLDSIYRLNPLVKCDAFLWSILHELGHHETMDLLDDDEYETAQAKKKEIESGERDTLEYYDLPDEKAATEWAVDYANNHIEELQVFWTRLQEKIMTFYRLNEVEP